MKQDVGETMSTMFSEATEKAKETPGQTTAVVRAYVSVVRQELRSTETSSDGTANNIYQVGCMCHD